MEHNTSVMYRALLRREKEHFAGRKIQDIGPDEIDADIKHIAGQGYSRWGVQVYLDMLRGKNILPKKAGLPPGVGREPTSQVWTCGGPTGTTCRFWPPWDQAPPPPIGPQNSALSTSRCGSRRTAPRCTSPSPQGTPGPPAEGCQTSGR